jgi:hypothetical protein
MPRLLLSALLSLLIVSSGGARQSTFNMSCGQARALVASVGAVVLSTGRYTYERFVATPGYCLLGEWAYWGYAPTTDSPQCLLGYVCKPEEPLWHDD